MLVTVVAVLCSLANPEVCYQQEVTSPGFAEMTMQACLMGVPQLAEWMSGRPAYRLAQWKCVLGKPAERT